MLNRQKGIYLSLICLSIFNLFITAIQSKTVFEEFKTTLQSSGKTACESTATLLNALSFSSSSDSHLRSWGSCWNSHWRGVFTSAAHFTRARYRPSQTLCLIEPYSDDTGIKPFAISDSLLITFPVSSGSLDIYPQTQTNETHPSHPLSSPPGDIDPYIPTQMISTAQ